ncbi:WYL domain-containing protein [Scytonema sp. NUACC26]|uniref:WYL domain-containing protein n=1 Tax=Scytonema sp. NUACC26 TaxID=3140176 RepID=UPI0034DBDB61
MNKKSRAINLSISELDKAQLEKIALEFGMKWGNRPNISKLVEAIARRKLVIAPNNDWSETLITALKQAVDALTDAGKIEEALVVADLLLQRSELSLPLRAEVERFLGNPPPAWRIEVNRYICREQPFQLSYQDATGKLWNFTVRHAKVVPHEERQYLDCWCEETEGNQDVEQLHHNWSLRLDRISEAGVFPLTGKWRSNLAELPVEMHIFGRLAFAYKTRNEDTESELLPTSPPMRRVVRRISSTYWFIREVLRDAPDIVIVSPESVRGRLKQKIISFYERYDMEI